MPCSYELCVEKEQIRCTESKFLCSIILPFRNISKNLEIDFTIILVNAFFLKVFYISLLWYSWR